MGGNEFPFVVAGDFNIIRKIEESSKRRKLSKWSLIFNVVIQYNELMVDTSIFIMFSYCYL